jgi:hypothetical protein
MDGKVLATENTAWNLHNIFMNLTKACPLVNYGFPLEIFTP